MSDLTDSDGQMRPKHRTRGARTSVVCHCSVYCDDRAPNLEPLPEWTTWYDRMASFKCRHHIRHRYKPRCNILPALWAQPTAGDVVSPSIHFQWNMSDEGGRRCSSCAATRDTRACEISRSTHITHIILRYVCIYTQQLLAMSEIMKVPVKILSSRSW